MFNVLRIVTLSKRECSTSIVFDHKDNVNRLKNKRKNIFLRKIFPFLRIIRIFATIMSTMFGLEIAFSLGLIIENKKLA